MTRLHGTLDLLCAMLRWDRTCALGGARTRAALPPPPPVGSDPGSVAGPHCLRSHGALDVTGPTGGHDEASPTASPTRERSHRAP